MEININTYLYIILVLLAFFCAIIFFFKNQQSHFTPVESGIPNVEMKPKPIYMKQEPNVYQTQDTRMEYPLLAPVNPIARRRTIQTDLPAERDLFNNQEYGTNYYMLDTPAAIDTNQLLTSGGPTQMIKIPLQFNEPYDEQLRTQDILITPYNKVKYGTC
jgi:hypothetical protein